jgi:hypothetical protein
MTENTEVTAAAIPSAKEVPVVLLEPRPEFNGSLLKYPGNPKVYLVDQGFRRWIQDPNMLQGIFKDNPEDYIVENQLILDVPKGNPILPGTDLARGVETAPVYLVEPGPMALCQVSWPQSVGSQALRS